MANPFVAEIRMFAGNFAPTGWALCDGQLLSISQNTALFSLLGTTYGGDGRSTFGLPNLQGNAPLQAGQGNGLSLRDLGETGGEQFVTLLQTEMPVHSHGTKAETSGAGSVTSPVNAAWSKTPGRTAPPLYTPGPLDTPMSPLAVGISGGNLPHNNMPPYLGITFIIALQGVFPPR
jgi:microcystin-dependent protein